MKISLLSLSLLPLPLGHGKDEHCCGVGLSGSSCHFGNLRVVLTDHNPCPYHRRSTPTMITVIVPWIHPLNISSPYPYHTPLDYYTTIAWHTKKLIESFFFQTHLMNRGICSLSGLRGFWGYIRYCQIALGRGDFANNLKPMWWWLIYTDGWHVINGKIILQWHTPVILQIIQ